MASITPQLVINFSRSGTVSPPGSYEDVTNYIQYQRGFQASQGRYQLLQLSPLAAGAAEGMLDNRDLRFSPDYASSPLAGSVIPGLQGYLNVTYAGTVYPLLQGYTQQSDDKSLISQQNYPLRIYDALGKFNAVDVETAMYTSIRSDVAIGHVLDELGWPAGKRILDTGAATFARWCATGKKGLEAIRDIVLSEGPPAIAYIDGNNNFVFEGRHYRLLTSRCTTSQATFRDTGTEPCYSSDDPRDPLENVINSATIRVAAYASAASQPLTVTGRALPLTLAPSEAVTFTVTPPSGASFFDTAVASTVVSAGSVSSAFNRTSGGKATLTVTAGAGGATLTSVSATGTSYIASYADVSNSVDASASITKYGTRTLPDEFQPVWVPTVADGVDYCDYVVGRYQEFVRINAIGIDTAYAARALQGVTRGISDRVTIVQSRTGGSADFFVEQIKRQFLPGPIMVTTLGVEKASAQSYWVLGDATYGVLGSTTVLAY